MGKILSGFLIISFLSVTACFAGPAADTTKNQKARFGFYINPQIYFCDFSALRKASYMIGKPDDRQFIPFSAGLTYGTPSCFGAAGAEFTAKKYTGGSEDWEDLQVSTRHIRSNLNVFNRIVSGKRSSLYSMVGLTFARFEVQSVAMDPATNIPLWTLEADHYRQNWIINIGFLKNFYRNENASIGIKCSYSHPLVGSKKYALDKNYQSDVPEINLGGVNLGIVLNVLDVSKGSLRKTIASKSH